MGNHCRWSKAESHEYVALWSGRLISNFILFKPELTWRYWYAILEGDIKSVAAVIRDYDMPFFDYNNSVRGSRDAAVHGILECAGHAKRYRRSPYYSLNDREQEELHAFIVKLFGK